PEAGNRASWQASGQSDVASRAVRRLCRRFDARRFDRASSIDLRPNRTRRFRRASVAHLGPELFMGPILTCLDLADRLLDFLFRLLAQLAKVFQNPLQYFLVCFTGMELHRFESLLGFFAELICCDGRGDGYGGSG